MAQTYSSTVLGTTKIVTGTTTVTTPDGSVSTYEFDIDYTLLLEAMLAKLTSIDTHITNIDAKITSIEELANGQKTPGDAGGISTEGRASAVQGFQRALIVNALKTSNQLDNVISEFNSPTTVPGL